MYEEIISSKTVAYFCLVIINDLTFIPAKASVARRPVNNASPRSYIGGWKFCENTLQRIFEKELDYSKK